MVEKYLDKIYFARIRTKNYKWALTYLPAQSVEYLILKQEHKKGVERRLLPPRPNDKVRNKIGGVIECFTHYQKTKIQGGAGVIFSLFFFLLLLLLLYYLNLSFKFNLRQIKTQKT